MAHRQNNTSFKEKSHLVETNVKKNVTELKTKNT